MPKYKHDISPLCMYECMNICMFLKWLYSVIAGHSSSAECI